MLNGRALWECQLIEVKCADCAHKSACDLSNRLVKRCIAHSCLFGFKAERPCFEKVSRGHKTLGMLSCVSRSPSYGRLLTPVQPASERMFSFTIVPRP